MQDLPRLTEVDNHLAIFVLATYGEGDPSDNAQEFHEWLKEADVDLAGINYTVRPRRPRRQDSRRVVLISFCSSVFVASLSALSVRLLGDFVDELMRNLYVCPESDRCLGSLTSP